MGGALIKAGLIVGAGMFLCVLVAAVVSPLCASCVAILAGVGAGYLTGAFEKPSSSAEVIRRGAAAGAIAAGMAFLAQILAAVINATVMQNPQFQGATVLLGLPLLSSNEVWIAQLLAGVCLGILNVGITAGLGAGGGAIWFSTAGKRGSL